MKQEIGFDLKLAHEHFAKSTNGRTWELLKKDARTEAEDFEMQAAVYASIYHWMQIGTALNLQRADWLIAHVLIGLGDAKAALKHATRCYQYTLENPDLMQDFDLAYGYEGIARANGLMGNVEAAKSYYEKARAAGEAIADEEDRGIFMTDFEAGEWFGIT